MDDVLVGVVIGDYLSMYINVHIVISLLFRWNSGLSFN